MLGISVSPFHFRFYRACTLVQMRGLGIACRPSVCPSVTLVICDHIGWKSRKLIARTISPTPSLFVAERRSTYSQGNMGKFWGDLRWGKGKSGVLENKSGIAEHQEQLLHYSSECLQS